MSKEARQQTLVSRISEEKEFCKLLKSVVKQFKSEFFISASELQGSRIALDAALKSGQWDTNPNFEGVGFAKAGKRCAYLNKYGTCHSGLTRLVVNKFFTRVRQSLTSALFNRSELSVISIGGGTGVDIIGFCSAIFCQKSSFETLNLTVLGKAYWETVFYKIISLAAEGSYGSISHLFRDVEINPNFIEAATLDHFSAMDIYAGDVVLMVKVFPVISTVKKKSLLKEIFNSLRPGAILIYIDDDGAEEIVKNSKSHYLDVLLHSGTKQFDLQYHESGQFYFTKYQMCVVQKRFRDVDNLICEWFHQKIFRMTMQKQEEGDSVPPSDESEDTDD